VGRKSTLDERRVYKVVANELARSGRVTVEALVSATELSMGSIYHRFGSREGLLAEAWLNAVEQFQTRFLAALSPMTIDAAVDAALTTPRFCRSNRDEAVLLACCRQSEFCVSATPAPLRARIESANVAASAAIRRFADRVDRPRLACRLALVAYPLGAVRLYLPERAVPVLLDTEIAKAVRAALAIGSRP
jgi:AcrR family transcriptional regulator